MLIFLLAYLLLGIFLAIGSYQDDREAMAFNDKDEPKLSIAMQVAFFILDTLFLPLAAVNNKILQLYMFLERKIVEKF